MTTKTYHDGANAERKAFRAKLRRLLKNSNFNVMGTLETLLEWVNGRDARYKKRKGGL